MQLSLSVDWVLSVFLMSLRLSPAFALAPPFTLVPVPAPIRIALAIGLALCLADVGLPAKTGAALRDALITASIGELVIGMSFVFALHAAFGALYFAGRVLDIQAGFGLATLIDPTSRAATPLLGTLFAYAAGILFFVGDGSHELVRLWGDSLQALPVGVAAIQPNAQAAISLIASVFAIGLGAAAAGMVVLFLIDVAIAFMSRAMPQLNVLVLGLQVKTIAILLVLASSVLFVAPILLRTLGRALQLVPSLL